MDRTRTRRSSASMAQIAGSLLGEGEDEVEGEDEEEYFFKKIGRFVKRHSGLLRRYAKIAGPMIATAVGGPAAGAAARLLTRQLEEEARRRDGG